MEQSALSRRRQNGAVPAKPPPMRLRRERHAHQNSEERQIQAASAATANAFILQDGFEASGHRRIDTVPTIGSQSTEEGERQRNFAVVNVGAGGVLYLKPSRMATPNVLHAPATPPATYDIADSYYAPRPAYRESNASGTWTPRAGGSLAVTALPEPELTLETAKAHDRRRHRSQSCSTIHNPNEVSKLAPTREERLKRRRSSTDLATGGLLDMKIPHYRLGTPRFSDLGTAYLHNSIYTVSTVDGVPSSIISKADYDSIFPLPPGRESMAPGGSIYLHPPQTYTARDTATHSLVTSTRPATVDGTITPALFDKLERNLGDPAVVRFQASTGRIIAATPARLIAQITSPQFLDYELLADFFLTFRCFMPARDVLEYLFARMRWAFGAGNDAGRIARVRTFVALRHWILNYFMDDFRKDGGFRRNFCDLVNELTRSLQETDDPRSGNINIVGELKKCWRRTCAVYWPMSDANETDPEADIVPGGLPNPAGSENSLLSLPLTIRPTNERASIFEMTQIELPDLEERTRQAWASEKEREKQSEKEPAPDTGRDGATAQVKEVKNRDTIITNRTASIPTSPLSVQSLEVLSCSVPFLRNMRLRPTARARDRDKPSTPQSKIAKAIRPTHTHKRSGSFSDALRDKRTPLSSPKADNIELKDLPSFAITGGLVRGILLQPSPAKVDSNVPVTPGPEVVDKRSSGLEGYLGTERHHHIGVKKFVGEVRRALSIRKGGSSSRSPSRTLHSAGSSTSRGGSRGSDRAHREVKQEPDWQQLGGPPRLDLLGAKIESSYKEAREEVRLSKLQPMPKPEAKSEDEQDEGTAEDSPAEAPGTPRPGTAQKLDQDKDRDTEQSYDAKDFGRLNSHVTTGSRSIVIVDATGAPELPPMKPEALTSLSSMSTNMAPIPLFQDRRNFGASGESRKRDETHHSDQGTRWQSADSRMHSLLTGTGRWSAIENLGRSSDDSRPRSSSGVLPKGVYVPQLPNQIRRVPAGGDLKTANNVHELESMPRPHSTGTFSATTHSITTSLALLAETDGSLNKMPLVAIQRKSSVSLLHTHSSQPILRDSFKSEIVRLKNMPDRESTGGIEDTLLKLEGKIPSPSYTNFSGGSTSDLREEDRGHTPTIMRDMSRPILQQMPNGELKEVRMLPVLKQLPDGRLVEVDISEVNMEFGNHGFNGSSTGFTGSSQGFTDSTQNFNNSTPALDTFASPMTETQGASIFHPSGSMAPSRYSRALIPVHLSPTSEHRLTASSVSSSNSALAVPGRNNGRYSSKGYSGTSTPESFARVSQPASAVDGDMSNGRYSSYRASNWRGQGGTESFLLSENDTLSDISTEIADPSESGVRSFYFNETSHEEPLEAPPLHTFETPPSTAGGGGYESPDRRQLLPRITPRQPQRRILKSKISHPKLEAQAANQPFPRRDGNESRQRGRTSPESTIEDTSSHMPFVLAFESEVIAEQLTIIEKDALDEVDWKDLISLNWQQSPPTCRNWVDYLNRETANGIDIVIARFNLVVKWCVSEVVLTELPSERARAITKYIHIASHCHRLHNYASLYQITLGLLSSDLARLKKTWSLVALREKQMLEHLEQLCRPLRNFQSLRAEMETAMPGNGIIPFIGLYTHDLMFNALKSARINSTAPEKEPLINFERYQTAAMIVKNLLRLTEASSRYTFSPDTEALSRCLWIAALSDQEIAQRSRALEQS
ncbi:unnamed protein product [Zymoseptoria tritici ST99CH_3D1]|nr:unnamed protein product [Zymoseptoria tritici ST99CH_3D1]